MCVCVWENGELLKHKNAIKTKTYAKIYTARVERSLIFIYYFEAIANEKENRNIYISLFRQKANVMKKE